MRKILVAFVLVGLIICMNPCFSSAQEDVIKLPPPQKDGGMPLMKALSLRKSTRGNFGPEKPLSMQTISNLLWAADGINRPGTNHRTAPSAADWQNIEIYVLTKDGVFLYDAPQHSLKVITNKDMRADAGLEGASTGPMKQDFAKTAPVSLVYVADLAKTKSIGNFGNEPVGLWWSAVGVGAIAQNVYLFCASENLACIVRAMVDADKLSKVFKLGPDQKVMITSTIAQFKE